METTERQETILTSEDVTPSPAAAAEPAEPSPEPDGACDERNPASDGAAENPFCGAAAGEPLSETAPTTDMSFADFEISDCVVAALHRMNYHMPTKVQAETISVALTGRDMIVLSKTGSGKTAAFGVPMVQLLMDKKVHKALVLAPTRELAVQVQNEIRSIADGSHVRSTVVYGKHSMNAELEELEKGVEILVGTPGRVFDHIEQGNIVPGEFDMLVLDEADRMLDMGFIRDVNRIMSKLAKKRVNLLFSATMPGEIVRLTEKYLTDPHRIELESDVKTVDRVEQAYYRVERNQKRTALLRLLAAENPASCLVFCNTRFEVDRVSEYLTRKGVAAKSIHGANSQSSRLKFLSQFKKGQFGVLVATDVAARGLHIEDLELVINYDVPVEKDSYIHRIGRTGRAGKAGKALTFVSEGDLFAFYMIEEHAGTPIEERQLPSEAEVSENLKKFMANSERYGIRFEDEKPERRSKKRGTKPTEKSVAKPGAKKKGTATKKQVASETEQGTEIPGAEERTDSARRGAAPNRVAAESRAAEGRTASENRTADGAADAPARPKRKRNRKKSVAAKPAAENKTEGLRRVASYSGESAAETASAASGASAPTPASGSDRRAPKTAGHTVSKTAARPAVKTPDRASDRTLDSASSRPEEKPGKRGFFARLFGKKEKK